MGLHLAAITIRDANDFVERFHRHSKRVVGARFAIAATANDQFVGVAIIGRPVSRHRDDGQTAELTRCCSCPSAPRNTCSFLYGRAWRAWQALGGKRMITYTLQSETGASLRGAGYKLIGETKTNRAGWNSPSRPRGWQDNYAQKKFIWSTA